MIDNTIHFSKHIIHGFMVIVIQKPNRRVFFIFFKWNYNILIIIFPVLVLVFTFRTLQAILSIFCLGQARQKR